jgi:hypothetical protein
VSCSRLPTRAVLEIHRKRFRDSICKLLKKSQLSIKRDEIRRPELWGSPKLRVGYLSMPEHPEMGGSHTCGTPWYIHE